jgi:hypothetical protein
LVKIEVKRHIITLYPNDEEEQLRSRRANNNRRRVIGRTNIKKFTSSSKAIVPIAF